jgi:hypothetical protein
MLLVQNAGVVVGAAGYGELPGFFLSKPFTTDTLLSLVRQASGRAEGSARLILG